MATTGEDELAHDALGQDDRAYVDIGGSALLAIVAAIALLAAAVIGAFYLIGRERNDAISTGAVSSASSSLAGAASSADQDAVNAGKAAQAEASH